ncbi:hypothetical protein [Bacillus niameyensis]|uniref:hypothetical protein n=1 Tax=Bacillus niameyensis TaxID=1522308 RepID=UPI000A6F9533|nr:hypothetical protein [Bacillus niameyensis]
MSSTTLFVLAAVIAVISILIVFKINLDKLKQSPENRDTLQTKFFIGVAIAEIIPIILVVLAFAASKTVTATSDLYVPGLIILLTFVFAPFFIFLQTKVDVTEKNRGIVTTFAFMGMSIALSIPIVSLVGLITLMP